MKKCRILFGNTSESSYVKKHILTIAIHTTCVKLKAIIQGEEAEAHVFHF